MCTSTVWTVSYYTLFSVGLHVDMCWTVTMSHYVLVLCWVTCRCTLDCDHVSLHPCHLFGYTSMCAGLWPCLTMSLSSVGLHVDVCWTEMEKRSMHMFLALWRWVSWLGTLLIHPDAAFWSDFISEQQEEQQSLVQNFETSDKLWPCCRLSSAQKIRLDHWFCL